MSKCNAILTLKEEKRMSLFSNAVSAIASASNSVARSLASGVHNSITWYKKHVTWG